MHTGKREGIMELAVDCILDEWIQWFQRTFFGFYVQCVFFMFFLSISLYVFKNCTLKTYTNEEKNYTLGRSVLFQLEEKVFVS